jgi:cobalt-zinc-cadmium efflux system protein
MSDRRPPQQTSAMTTHDHDHGHSHGGHVHGVSADADRRKLAIALGLIVSFMGVEVAVGIAVSSLALLSDAAHMLTDASAIALSLVAIRLAARPAAGAMTYGLKRSEILAAQFNGATLLVLGVLIVIEGVNRLISPPDVQGAPVLIVAVFGILVNLAATWTLSKANRRSLNVEGAFQHLLTDLFAFIATAIAGGVILLTGFREADGIAALFISATMLYAAYGLLKASGRAMASHPDVFEVHDLHVWEVTSGFPALSAHVLVDQDADCHAARRAIERTLHDQFAIDHTTIQVDHARQELLDIQPATT